MSSDGRDPLTTTEAEPFWGLLFWVLFGLAVVVYFPVQGWWSAVDPKDKPTIYLSTVSVGIALLAFLAVLYQIQLARFEVAHLRKEIARSSDLSVSFKFRNKLNLAAARRYEFNGVPVDNYATATIELDVNNDGNGHAERFYVLLYLPDGWVINREDNPEIVQLSGRTLFRNLFFAGMTGYQLAVAGPSYPGFPLRLPPLNVAQSPVGLQEIWWQIASLDGKFPKSAELGKLEVQIRP